MKAALFSTAYLPSISAFASMLHAEQICFDKHEHFIKQTYRNRAHIYSANGLQQLVIPVRHENLYRIPINEVLIANDTPWQKIHWRSITSAYRKSPYFEYFENDFSGIFESPAERLFDFNLTLTKKISEVLRISFTPEFTAGYEKNPEAYSDLRNHFNPDQRNLNLPLYNQVFADRHGYLADLSVLDLLFNKGMETKSWLSKITSGE